MATDSNILTVHFVNWCKIFFVINFIFLSKAMSHQRTFVSLTVPSKLNLVLYTQRLPTIFFPFRILTTLHVPCSWKVWSSSAMAFFHTSWSFAFWTLWSSWVLSRLLRNATWDGENFCKWWNLLEDTWQCKWHNQQVWMEGDDLLQDFFELWP